MFRSKITWNGLTSIVGDQGNVESTFEINGISSNPISKTAGEFGNSTSSTWGIWESNPEVNGISSKLASTSAHEFGNSLFSTSSRNDASIKKFK